MTKRPGRVRAAVRMLEVAECGWRGDCSDVVPDHWALGKSAAAAARRSQVASRDWGSIRVEPITGMKLLSPFHRGTIWPCK